MRKTQPYYRFVLLLSFIFLAGNAVLAQINSTPFSYEEHWDKVAQMAKEDRPESALKEVGIILKQAESDKNSVQLIKGSVQAMVLTLKTDPDKAPAQIAGFEALIEKTTDASDKALLQSMTAELYLKYYSVKSWEINKRTEINGLAPGGLAQWTKNNFSDKICSLLNASLQNAQPLQKTDIEKYTSLLTNADNKELEPTLYDLLAKRKINILTSLKNLLYESDFDVSLDLLYLPSYQFIKAPLDTTVGTSIDHEIIRTYQQWLRFRIYDTNTSALIFLDINRMVGLNSLISKKISQYDSDRDMRVNAKNTAYIKALEALENNMVKFNNEEHVIRIRSIVALLYQSQYNRNDSIRKYYLRKAYDICADGIARYPNCKDVSTLKIILNRSIQKSMSITNNDVVKPHSTLNIELFASNLDRVELTVYRVNTNAQDYYKNDGLNLNHLDSHAIVIDKRWIDLKKDSNFNSVKTIIPIKTGAYGIYEFTLSTNEDPSEQVLGRYVVSDLAYMAQNSTIIQCCVVDRVSGKPIPKVRINVFSALWMQGKTDLSPLFNNCYTNNMGIVEFNPLKYNNTNTVLFFERGADKYLTSVYRNYRYNNVRKENKSLKMNVFTDRSLYRPGQTVYVKGIAYHSNSEVQEVAADESIEISLIDANQKRIAVKTLRTNEFGSFADSFTLPEDGLNGGFSLQTKYSYTNFWVEAYKRPTFEVTMERPKTEVHFGDSIRLRGKVTSYSGYPVSDANVVYQINRRSHYRILGRMSQSLITSKRVHTSADGTFEVVFQAQRNNIVEGNQFYVFEVSATVTDQKGETQIGVQSISVGDKSLFIVSDLSNVEKMDKTKETALDVHLETLNNEKVEGTVHYELIRLEQPLVYMDKIMQNSVIEGRGTSVLSGTFETKDGKLKLDLKNMESGYYRMEFFTLDNRKDTVESSKKFVLYSMNDKHPPVKTYSWFIVSKSSLKVGEKANIKFGSSAENVHVLFQILKADSILESKWFTVSNAIRTFDMPFLSNYGLGVNVLFTFVKDEMLFVENISLSQKIEKRELSPKLTVFRDKLQPGERAEWTINIPEAVDKKQQAELLVDMYDASLDAIRPHSMYFEPVYRAYIPMSPRWTSTVSQLFYGQYKEKLKDLTFSKSYSQVDWMGLRFFEQNKSSAQNVRIGSMSSASVADLQEHKVVIEERPVFGINDALQGRIAGLDITNNPGMVKSKSEPSTKIRTNFNETAFFYPQLRTDIEGNVKFSFTVPESLTRWNVKMLAHTKDLYYGFAENQVVTQKDLMVQLNLPRFVRRSDKLVVRASVVNLTDTIQKTNVKLELIDPSNSKVIALKDGLTKTVVLAARETKFVEWELTEFAPFEMVVCKVVGNSELFSDGEQRYLPVLPDQVFITETLPMTVRANQTKNFTLENLLKNGSNVTSQSLTVEFSPNPAWYAVQALPTLSVSENENAIDYFTAYYVNTLASYIANSNPKLSAVFDQWKLSSQSRNALLSNLEKNKELKTMLLEETPWLLAAQNETEQKRQIALLFDLNQQKQQNAHYWEKLIKLQGASGGFSWFKDMPENPYITQYILLNAARLNTMIKTSPKTYDATILKAIAFIDNAIAKDYERLKSYRTDYKTTKCIGDMQWFYLHVRSEYPEVSIPDFAREAVDYYTSQALNYWQKATLYGKAASALIAARNQDKKLASQIMVSLKENAVKSDEMGMYWARNTPGYFWHQRPVMVQTMLLEAFAEVSKNTTDLDEMKIWLLRQKQTQRWDSPLSTVDAIYALLKYGTDWISSSNDVSIQLGSTALKTEQKEAGSGYIKQTFTGKEVLPSMARAKVELKGASGFGWGAMYWQYFQNLKEVKQSGNSLTVSKKLFVEKLLPTGKSMSPIENVKLKVGDKVITRLVVTVDRDMEYVALKDLRAACFEPFEQRSGCVWKEGVSYYQTTKDASTQFFFATLPKGNYVFEYAVWVNNAGEFTSGITTLQCQYAPEFSSHSGGERLVVSQK